MASSFALIGPHHRDAGERTRIRRKPVRPLT
jgi:hypothetical protein